MNLTRQATAGILALALAEASISAAAQQQAGSTAPAPAPTQQQGDTTPAPAPAQEQGAAAPTESQAEAREILMRMARYLSQLPRFSVNVVSSYDAVQPSGEKIEFWERRKVVLDRPDRLRVDTVRSDGRRTTAVFTGTELVLLDETNNVYASEKQPGGIDESILHFVSDLGMRLPLAVLLMGRLPAEFERRVRSIDYVEKTSILGAPAHHLAARGDTVDFQIWVKDGAQPLPLRVVLTYKNEPGQPEFRAQLVDWDLAPAITAATFQPHIPAGAHKILFASQLGAVRAGGQGGKQ